MPAILHENEAVIPLSRGRSVPVELRNDRENARGAETLGRGTNIGPPNISVNFHGVKDADTIRRSETQMKAMATGIAQRAAQKNN